MLCGTPVLAYGRGAVPEVVLHEETGFVAHSYAELRQGLRQLFRLDPYRSRDFVIQQFSWERMVSAHLDLYRATGQ
jgi:glycosyltransferase involved in cell wall biosynthesis